MLLSRMPFINGLYKVYIAIAYGTNETVHAAGWRKNVDVETPISVADFLLQILIDYLEDQKQIFSICIDESLEVERGMRELYKTLTG